MWRLPIGNAPVQAPIKVSPKRLDLPSGRKLVNIVTGLGTGGIYQDGLVVQRLFDRSGWESAVVSYREKSIPDAHLSVFIERAPIHLMAHARRNWLIPNLECVEESDGPPYDFFRRWNLVLCKTKAAFRVVETFVPDRVRFTGFETPDLGEPPDSRLRSPEFIHVAGGGAISHRGTVALLRAWRPEWPHLTVTVMPHIGLRQEKIAIGKNVTIYEKLLDDGYIKALRDRCLYAIQPSRVEGWGHAIREAMLAGCVTVTTDSENLLDIPDDAVIRIKTAARVRSSLSTACEPTPAEITAGVERALALSPYERRSISKRGRAAVLADTQAFHERFMTRVFHEGIE